jgi:hypothetical protein
MRARWALEELAIARIGELLFTSTEAERMRERLSSGSEDAKGALKLVAERHDQ